MKTSPLSLAFLSAIAAPAAILVAGCSKTDSGPTAADQVKSTVTTVTNAVADSWDSVKDFTYDRRVEFTATVDRMTGQLDDKVTALKVKVVGAPGTPSAAWTGATKDYDDARADLKARMTDLGNATSDTWSDAKDKVSAAWKHVQSAYDKVTASAGS
jgi:hypothetical protein